MIIAIDIGNSFIKWKSWPHRTGFDVARVPHRQAITALREAFTGCVPEQIVVANVANHGIEDELRGLWPDVPLVSIKSCAECLGVLNVYSEPERLGVDRWLAIIEAYHRSNRQAACVIDLGTAATLDIVDQAGVHQGGYIAPGLTLMRQSLLQSTRRVLVEEPLNIARTYGVNTAQAVDHGIVSLILSWIEQEVVRFRKQYPDGVVYLTGGDAMCMQHLLTVNEINVYEELVLDGLLRIATS